MHTLPITTYPEQSQPLRHAPQPPLNIDPAQHRDRVVQELRSLGMTWYGLLQAETRYLPHILHPDEHLGGVVYGKHSSGFALLAATDRRILFLDVKPLFIEEDEATYDVVSGISYGQAGIWSTVTLHTKVRDYKIKTYNQRCAKGFIAFIESRCLERRLGDVQ